ncbi:hypothetical protein [Rhodococcus sp. 14-2483-1-2]|uniref:hypothetical protein n=1 Tax=Rhodococcus sp. 14-2483-1-2 TaxID=2023147 RepID=UPI000B9C4017|nr:hypothetical protein [Rhodococcus sp. 14-2483-1-2]OZF25982.1 hypothetical protein CH295_25380 [Rhodococcus sp. 14-2483-1-2]
MSKKRDPELAAKLEALLVDARTQGSRTPENKLAPATAALVDLLWDPAVATLHTLVSDGRIVSAGPIPVAMTIGWDDLEWLRSDYADRDALCIELAVAGLTTFLRAAVDRKIWTPSGRASLLTYFVNACLLHKLHVINKWTMPRRIERRLATLADVDDLDALTLDLSDIPYASHAAQILVDRATPQVRRLFEALLQGETIAGAATAMGIDPATARTHLFRFRKNVVVPLIADGFLDPPSGTALAKHMENQHADELSTWGPTPAEPEPDFDPFTSKYVPGNVFASDWEPTDVY